ncbi:hypothetical protein SO694_0011504 [Aureococcus anophagefferens]|uniref:Uncharacterized protein n=1 Tax=Aureococcus anophagefferens TaxID=44056 RepID=A0ABR1FWT4_AURAN
MVESAGEAEAVARDYLQVMAWWNALEITDATSTTRFRTQTDEERLQAALALVAAYLRGGATATLVLPVSLGLDDDCWRRFGDLVGGAGCVVRRREVRRQFATAWRLSAHAMAVAKARAAPKRARARRWGRAPGRRDAEPAPGPPPPTREPPSPELGTESLARDSVDVARFDVDAEPAPAVPESPARRCAARRRPRRPPRPRAPSRRASPRARSPAACAARGRAPRRPAPRRAAPPRARRARAAAAGERGDARAPWLARLAGAGAAAAVPETLVVGALGTRRAEAATLAAGAATPATAARGARAAGGAAAPAPPRGPAARGPRGALGPRRAGARARVRGARSTTPRSRARATAPRPEAGELRLIQAWVPPRGADSHLVVVWTARGGLGVAARAAAPEVGVRRAVPLGPEPVATAWLLDALAAVAGVAAALARDAATRAPAPLDLAFKLGARERAPPPLLRPPRPPSAKGPRRRPFQKRCEKPFKRQIAHPMEITVLSYLGADRDDARSGKERNIARLEREFSQKRTLPTDFAPPTR